MFGLFKKSPEDISRTNPGFEETERKTPKAGVILLITMFIVGTFFGWYALDDLGNIPSRPGELSSCSYPYRQAYVSESIVGQTQSLPLYQEYGMRYEGYGGDSSRCAFVDIEKTAGIPEIFAKRIPVESEMRSLQDRLSGVSRSLYEIQRQLQNSTGQYDTGLQEKQAGVTSPIFPVAPSQETVVSLRNQEKLLQIQKGQLEKESADLGEKLKKIDSELSGAYVPVLKEYNRGLRMYEFKVFLLQFFFVVPFFILVLWGYLRLYRKNSPYTVIFTAMVGVASILLLRIILFWLWGLFLARVLEVLLVWFNNFQLLRSLVFYLGMLFSFLVFGGAVYLLQKKIFNPKRVALRRFRLKQCPQCQVNLDLSVFFCPNCGYQLKHKCEKCGQARFIALPACPYCGDRSAQL